MKIGYAPTRRSIFSAPDAIKYRGLVSEKLTEMGVGFVDIIDILNNTDSTKKVVDYLVQAGHEQIGYLKSNMAIRNFKHRYYGYQRGMFEQGLEIKEAYSVVLTPTLEGAYKDMLAYLESKDELPTAYITACESRAFLEII